MIGILVSMALIPTWFILLFILLSLLFFSIYMWTIYQNKKWNPEGKIFITARKKGNPVLCLFALNGFFKFVLGEKDKKGSPIFKHDKETMEGIHFDPRLQSGSVPKQWTIGGLEMLFGSTSSPFFISANNALAKKTVIEHVRKNYEVLNTLPDQVVLEYIERNRADLPHDCENLAKVFDLPILPENVNEFASNYEKSLRQKLEVDKSTLSDDEIKSNTDNAVKEYVIAFRTGYLAKTFQKIQDETIKIPIKSDRIFSFTEAFQNISSAFSAIDIQNFLQLFERLAQLDDKNKFERLLMMISAIGFAVLLVLVGVYVVGLNK